MPDAEEIPVLKGLLKRAIGSVYAESPCLLQMEGLEQALVFRVGIYLQELINDSDVLASLNLDCEYNKNLDETKRTVNFQDGIRPDLLIHKRGSHAENKLAVEFKGWWNKKPNKDIQKLKDLTNNAHDYQYRLGAFVVFHKQHPEYRFFQNGEEESEHD